MNTTNMAIDFSKYGEPIKNGGKALDLSKYGDVLEVPEEKEPSEPMYIGDSVTYVKQPESEKWRKECESDIYDAENSKYDKPLKEQTRWHKVQTKCTMYQAVLLEEIRKDLNED